MKSNLSISGASWRVSAILSVIYVLVTFSSLLLVGIETTSSWQATFLGIGWRTIFGFEIGLVGMVVAGFAIASFYVAGVNLFIKKLLSPSKTNQNGDPSQRTLSPLWAIRILLICFLLPALFLIALRWLAPTISSSKAHDATGATSTGTTAQIHPINLGSSINTAMREAEPSFTPDGGTMYFNCNNADICVTQLTGTWEQENWTHPQVVGPPISTEYEEIEPWITSAGDKLYFNSNRPIGILRNIPFLSPLIDVFEVVNMMASRSGISLLDGLGLGHVWVSYKVNGVWSEPRLLDEVSGEPPVNSAFHDHCLSFSADGNEAFWTSTRPGGFGSNDIWISRRVNGQWTQPENLGPRVNSPADEHHSIPSPDGKSLYITSNRAGGYGGDDMYVTTRGADGKWMTLVNLGEQINGPGDDRCAAWTPNLKIFLFDAFKAGGKGARDLWWVYFKDVNGYPLANLKEDYSWKRN